MAATARNKRIGELFLAAAGQKLGPALVNREIGLNTRIAACETLVRLRDGLGRHSRDRIKRILKELSLTAKIKFDAGKIDPTEFQNLADRLETIRLRIENMAENREAHQELTEAEIQNLRETAKPPFDVTGNDEVFWERDVTAKGVEWFLSIPSQIKFHISRRKSDAAREIPATTAV